MRQIWNVARREFRGYFDHPTAYVLVIAFLALALFFTFRSLYATGEASLRGTFGLLPWLLAVFVPAITMRSFAEERRSGTLEWLLAQPVSELQVLAGKFLGNWLFVMAVLAGTVPAALGVLFFSEADAGVMMAQYTGAALLALLLVATGLFASSATTNQITAFVLALAVNFVLLLTGLRVVTLGLPPVLMEAATRLAVLEHLDGIGRGVIDLRDVLYFLTTGVFFLSLGFMMLARERLSGRRGGYFRLRIGVVVLGVGVVVLNLLGARIHGRLDLTADNLYTLSPGTRQVLQNLDDMVTIQLVVSRELPPEVGLTVRDVRDILADYRRVGEGRVRVIELNPDRDEAAVQAARDMGIMPLQFNVMRGDEFQVKRGWFGIAVLHAGESEILPVIDRTDDLEYRLTSMIASMAVEQKPHLAFLMGFGALGPEELGVFREVLEERYRISVRDISFAEDLEFSPEEFDVVVLAAPAEPLHGPAVDLLGSYLKAGGAALLMVDGSNYHGELQVVIHVPTGLDPLLREFGVRVGLGTVYDMRSRAHVGQPGSGMVRVPYPFFPVVLPATEHVLTRGLNSLTLMWATAFDIEDPERVQPLWQTTELAGRQLPGRPMGLDVPLDPSAPTLGKQTVSVAIEWDRMQGVDGQVEREPGRMVLVGDGDFLRNEYVGNDPQHPIFQNVIFAANAVDWLVQDDALIAIRSKNRTPPPLIFESDTQQAALKWANLIGVPLLFTVLGLVRVLGRRRLRGRRWEEVGG